LKRGAVRLRRGVNWRELERSRLPRHGHATRCREVDDSLALEAHEPGGDHDESLRRARDPQAERPLRPSAAGPRWQPAGPGRHRSRSRETRVCPPERASVWQSGGNLIHRVESRELLPLDARSCTSSADGWSSCPRADRLVDVRLGGDRIYETGDGRVVLLEQPTRVAIRLRNRIHDLPMPCRGSRTPVNASISVEVSVGASDRFECKIAAMINRPSHRRDCGAGRRACAGYDALGAARVYPPGPAPRDAAKHACTPAAGHCLSAGATSLWKSEQWVCRLDWSAFGAWRMALDWAWDAA